MTRASKVTAGVFIACYLSLLSAGIVGHAMKIGLAGNTLSYFFVWDMFCGWQAYDQRTHLIAETDDGRFLEVREPWGEFCPYGNLGRFQYDFASYLAPKHIQHVLAHTEHAPISCVFLVQESWPKQYNLPDSLWKQNFESPPDKLSYFHLRGIYSEQGHLLRRYPDWFEQQRVSSIADNPRLKREAHQARSSFGVLYKAGRHRSASTGQMSADDMPATN